MKLNRVTITGVDEKCYPLALFEVNTLFGGFRQIKGVLWRPVLRHAQGMHFPTGVGQKFVPHTMTHVHCNDQSCCWGSAGKRDRCVVPKRKRRNGK